MPRGVKVGTKRGCYKLHSKPRLRKLARDIRAGKFDLEAVAHAFESTGLRPDRVIADCLRAGRQFARYQLARAVENLAAHKPHRLTKPLPIWMTEAARRHLPEEYGGKGEPIHKALGVEYPYAEHPRVRAYHRQLVRDYGPRSKGMLAQRLDHVWPQRTRGEHPELEKAIKESLSGSGVPLEVWRTLVPEGFAQ
jgi:hypothetical protein